jgi:hypothetical protein
MKSHVRCATGRKTAVHLHYTDDDSPPKQHPAKVKKVPKRRTGTGINRTGRMGKKGERKKS